MSFQDRLKFDACRVEVPSRKITGINAGKRIGRDSRYLLLKTLLKDFKTLSHLVLRHDPRPASQLLKGTVL
jgi:hypothetical protein